MKFFLLFSLICSISGFAQFTQQGNKLLGSDILSAAAMGASVALSADGNTAVVGGPADNLSGAVWIFSRVGRTWTQQGAKLTPSDPDGPAWFGTSVAVSADGNTAIIGGIKDNRQAGAVWTFTRSSGLWTQTGSKLTSTDCGGRFGTSVALSADGAIAIVGSPYSNNFAGAACVFSRDGASWSQQGTRLVPSDVAGSANFGASVALSGDGNTALIGGFLDHSNMGAAWIFIREGAAWRQLGSKLVPADPSGNPVFGASVALSGDTALVGGPNDGDAGAAWVFTRTGSAWTQQGGKLIAKLSATSGARQGAAVGLSADGNTAIIGGPGNGGCDSFLETCIGASWVFRRVKGLWTEQQILLGTGQNRLLPAQGSAVALSADGSTAFIGGPEGQQYEGLGGYFVGAAWAYALPHLTFLMHPSVGKGTHFRFLLSACDANDLPLPDFTGILHFTSSDSAAILPADANVWSGETYFAAILETSGPQTIIAADTTNSGVLGAATITVTGPSSRRGPSANPHQDR